MSSISSVGQSPVLTKVKENVVWARDKTVEKIQSAASWLKQMAVKVWESTRDFFAPKFTAVKESLQGCFSRLTGSKPEVPVQPVETSVAITEVMAEAPGVVAVAEAPVAASVSPSGEKKGLFNIFSNWIK